MSEGQRLFVVLGMHRSGTSAITRALKALGVDLGDNLMGSASGENDKGFWEDNDIYQLDVELLNGAGHDWHTLSPVLPEHLDERDARSHLAEAAAMLRGKLAASGRFGMKDPRLPRLLPFWQAVFTHLQAEVDYLIVVRHPLSVARSLQRRNGFALEKSLHLWFQHMWSALAQSADESRVVVDYDAIVDAPLPQLQRMAQQLRLPFAPDAATTQEYVDEFLDAGLRHDRHAPEDLQLVDGVPGFVMQMYDLLTDLAADRLALDDPRVARTVAELGGAFREHTGCWRFMDACERNVAQGHRAVAESVMAIERLQAELSAEQQLAGALREHVAHEQRQVASLAALREEALRAIAEKDAQLVRHARQIMDLSGQLAAVQARA
ncbi:MAG TPA: hypothetical protein VFY12_09495, partial [Arenimonas sp.]|nr:hypothetical protein [Arenimonas sp.]